MSVIAHLKHQIKSVPVIRQAIERRRIRHKFATEIRLLHGEDPSRSDHPSIIHYSLNKSATQYVKKMLTTCAAESEMVPVHIQDYAFASVLPYLDTLSDEEIQPYKHLFKPRGYLYSAFGGLVEGIDDLDQYRVVLMTRDPRDILVSDYYSNAYSHPEPTSASSKNQSFYDLRNQALEQTVDEFALAQCDLVAENLRKYRDRLLAQHPHVYVTKYEDMVVDFERWFTDLLAACQLDVSSALKEQLVDQHYALRPRVEDQQSQLRKGVTGDYKNKLGDATIRRLNKELSKVLAYYHYEEENEERKTKPEVDGTERTADGEG